MEHQQHLYMYPYCNNQFRNQSSRTFRYKVEEQVVAMNRSDFTMYGVAVQDAGCQTDPLEDLEPRRVDMPALSMRSHTEEGPYLCCICQITLQGEEHVCRLPCRHLFHVTCEDQNNAAGRQRLAEASNMGLNQTNWHHSRSGPIVEVVPICRGSGMPICTWPYISSEVYTQSFGDLVQQPAHEICEELAIELSRLEAIQASAAIRLLETLERPAPPQQPSSSSQDNGFTLPSQIGPEDLWGPAQRRRGPISRRRSDSPVGASRRATSSRYPTNVYHGDTKLSIGRNALPVDLGSVGNIGGCFTFKYLEERAIRNKCQPSHEKRNIPLAISGSAKAPNIAMSK